MPPSSAGSVDQDRAHLSDLLRLVNSMAQRIDRLLEDRELIRGALNALQRQVASSIPVIQSLDHMQAIREQEKRHRQISLRAAEKMYWRRFDLPQVVAKRRKRGEDIPYHPGEILERDFLLPAKLSSNEVADDIGMKRAVFSRFRHGTVSVSPTIAERLARRFSTTPEFWLHLQSKHDRWWSENAELRFPPKQRAKPSK